MSGASSTTTGPRPGSFRAGMRLFLASPTAAVALVVFVGFCLAALFAPWLSPQNPYDLAQVDILDSLMPPGSQSFTGMTYWLGTDGQGRDMLSAILYGIRISLIVGLLSGFFALIVGTIVGLIAAYRRGWVETVLMRIVDLQLSFPTILVALVLLVILGRGVDKIIFALVVVQWAYFARTVRGVALVEGAREYVDAARGLQLGGLRILLGHILPNCLPTMLVVATMQMAAAISLEATLSFLGLGLPPTRPSLGLLIANGFDYLQSGRYWISVLPGLVLLAIIVSANLLGDRLRDVLNPHLRT
ncbi:ABC transporter permease subunit [Roseobacter sp. HKCCD9010]|uniref:ABC transporter permease n=1 Tax=unclassified Roseobacter TaxID=196798 RepID=UPI00149269CA|nr:MULTISPECIES: ABC transporter permease [unclassified Roseobacter]MBF9050724.1 ABC transporter permease subunit [Rhodobacterales bacterium HKCCD4356]NNV11858.1 ABC transporter permease subunit [Roseobacter sp. HKCCD7357]NNV18009.1 ABC transporter permease subunit [Roseobacter sp. HKCCD8768]NNV26100.1 ABC transporter permease subunit [Roseobacter sp. HKCCD8192]NNV31736.1 ABC transporter permease subunit [Roseobacter sp. HKCCD9061]